MKKRVRNAAYAALIVLTAACGKTDGGKTEGGKTRLVPEQECAAAFQRAQHGGNQARFVAACTQDMSLIACAGPARDSAFCQRAMADASKKQIIDGMVAALTAP